MSNSMSSQSQPDVSTLLSDPLRVAHQCFQGHVSSLNSGSEVEQLQQSSSWGFAEHVQKLLEDRSFVNQIPSLNDVMPYEIPDKTLVRFRCMVQDMHDPEYYMGVYKTSNPNSQEVRSMKYMDLLQLSPEDGDVMEVAKYERLPLMCVSVPGESDWARDALRYNKPQVPASSSQSNSKTKRPRNPADSDECDDAMMSDVPTATSSSSAPSFGSPSFAFQPTGGMPATQTAVSDKKMKPLQSAANGSTTTNTFKTGVSELPRCIVKVYDELRGAIKVNDVVEFVGVIAKDPLPDDVDEQFMSKKERAARHPPCSLVSRIHAIAATKVTRAHLLAPTVGTTDFQAALDTLRQTAEDTRESLTQYLTTLLGGDKAAANMLLCYIVSRTSSRVQGLPVGKFCLEITHCPDTLPALLHNFLQLLTPSSVLVNGDAASLNSTRLHPVKDYSTNTLKTSPLQVGAGTSILIDCTKPDTAKLTDLGKVNENAIQHLINWQKLEFDFAFHKLEFLADTPVLILNRSQKPRRFTVDCRVKLQPSGPLPNALPTVNIDLLNQWRRYVLVARQLSFSMGANASELVQQEMQAMRKRGVAVTEPALHCRVNLTRLLGISCLEESLNTQRWEHMQALSPRVVD